MTFEERVKAMEEMLLESARQKVADGPCESSYSNSFTRGDVRIFAEDLVRRQDRGQTIYGNDGKPLPPP